MKKAAVEASAAKRANVKMHKSPKFAPRWPEHSNKEHCSRYRNKVCLLLSLQYKHLGLATSSILQKSF